MKNLKTTYNIFLFVLLFSFQANAQNCSSGVVTLAGASLNTAIQPLCPSPFCASITWAVDLTAVNVSKMRRFSRIELNFPGTPCMGGTMPISNTAPMGSISATWNSTGKVEAKVFVEICQEPDKECDPDGMWSSPMEFCTFTSNQVDVLGLFTGEGNTTRNTIIGATTRTFTIDPLDMDFFTVSNLNDAFTWSLENVSTGGNYVISSTTGNATSASATLSIDECSDGDLVAMAVDKCGRTTEFKRFQIRRFCPVLTIDGPSGCDAIWCEDDPETFEYTIDANGSSSANIGFSVRFPGNLILIDVSPNVTISNSGSWTQLDAAEAFTFSVQPPFAANYFYPIIVGLEACEGTANSCNQTETVYLYSGRPNAIDLDLQVYGTSEWNKYQLCKYQFNYVEAYFNGVADPCILEWDWMVPAGWQIFFPDFPDKTVALIIPNSNYGTVQIRARNKCGWTNWIGYGFGTNNCKFKANENLIQPGQEFVGSKDSEEQFKIQVLPNEKKTISKPKKQRLIYPNPKGINDQLSIQTELLESNLPINIFNTQGIISYSDQLKSGTKNHELQLETMPAGIYWIKIGSADQVSFHKLVIID